MKPCFSRSIGKSKAVSGVSISVTGRKTSYLTRGAWVDHRLLWSLCFEALALLDMVEFLWRMAGKAVRTRSIRLMAGGGVGLCLPCCRADGSGKTFDDAGFRNRRAWLVGLLSPAPAGKGITTCRNILTLPGFGFRPEQRIRCAPRGVRHPAKCRLGEDECQLRISSLACGARH